MSQYVALPVNLEAEKVVLGSMMISPVASDIALGSLQEEDFSDTDPRNRLIFRSCVKLHESRRPIDPQTVFDMLVSLKLEKAAGGNAYIYELLNGVINPDNIDHYIEMVREQSVLRQLLITMGEIQDEYQKGVANIGEFINVSNDRISHIAQSRTVQGLVSAKDIAERVSAALERQVSSDNGVTGVPTGYRKLDNITHGWQNGDYIIVAARPSMGKTALGLNLAYNASRLGKKPVAFFSLEMSSDLLMRRLLSCCSSVSGNDLATGYLPARSRAKLATAVEEISKTQLFIDDTPNSNLGDIIAKAKKLKHQHPDLSMVVIDYLGRIRQGGKVESRQQEVSYISGELKTLARNLDVPVICLAQLNRGVEKTESKVPQLSDLRESGSIEQDADLVLLLHRYDYYDELGQGRNRRRGEENEGPKPVAMTEKQKKESGDMSEMTVIIGKNRNGKTGKVTLMFQKDYSRFSDPSPEYEAKKAEAERRYNGGYDEE